MHLVLLALIIACAFATHANPTPAADTYIYELRRSHKKFKPMTPPIFIDDDEEILKDHLSPDADQVDFTQISPPNFIQEQWPPKFQTKKQLLSLPVSEEDNGVNSHKQQHLSRDHWPDSNPSIIDRLPSYPSSPSKEPVSNDVNQFPPGFIKTTWPPSVFLRNNGHSTSEFVCLEDHFPPGFIREVPLTKAWQAPKYTQAQNDFEDAVSEFNRHFTSEALQGNGTINYIVIAQVINRFSSHVADHGWFSYDSNYPQLARLYIQEAFTKPRDALTEMQCHITKATQHSKEVSKIIKSDVVKQLCTAQPTSCNTLIYDVLKLANKSSFDRAVDVLLANGDAASTFLSSYAAVLDAISSHPLNLSTWILQQKEYFRELVAKNASVLRKVYPNGIRGCSTAQDAVFRNRY